MMILENNVEPFKMKTGSSIQATYLLHDLHGPGDTVFTIIKGSFTVNCWSDKGRERKSQVVQLNNRKFLS